MPQLFSHADQAQPVNCLIVDDEPETLDLLTEFCRRHGLEVAGARDGRTAMAEIARSPSQFDIVITDVNLPGADGFDVLRAARQANPSSYVVIITGYATLDSAVRAVREGAYDYLAKPFSLGQLEIVLWRIRDRMMLERENRDLLKRQAAAGPRPGAQPVDLASWLLAVEERLERIERLIRERQP
jgi:two-component system response regulator AtoC